jgi:hypothetical protein
LGEDLTATAISVINDSGDFVRRGVRFDYEEELSTLPSSLHSRIRPTNLKLSLHPSALFLTIFLLDLSIVLESRHELLGDNIDLFGSGTKVSKNNQ